MSRMTPFEKVVRQKMSELPLPDENASWQAMQALLEKEEKRKNFFLLRNGKSWLLTALFLMVPSFLWMFFHAGGDQPIRTRAVAYQKDAGHVDNRERNPDTAWQALNKPYGNERSDTAAEAFFQRRQNSPDKNETALKPVISFTKEEKGSRATPSAGSGIKKAITESSLSEVNTKQSRAIKRNTNQKNTNAVQSGERGQNVGAIPADSAGIFSPNQLAIPGDSAGGGQPVSSLAASDSMTQKNSATNTVSAAPVKAKRKKPYFIDAGIELKQAIPVSGQQFAGVNYNGSKNFMSDYIPSVYLRIQKSNKWFLQTGFTYAAPRFVKSSSFTQNTKADYARANVTFERQELKKTFYNQVPVSLNWYIRPALSAGAGIVFNRLHSVIISEETLMRNELTGDQVLRSRMIPVHGYTDSFFYKTKNSLLLQAAYERNRWSAGVSYTKDLQPYMTYLTPSGLPESKKNTSLELMIRYRLFRSGRFRLKGF